MNDKSITTQTLDQIFLFQFGSESRYSILDFEVDEFILEGFNSQVGEFEHILLSFFFVRQSYVSLIVHVIILI